MPVTKMCEMCGAAFSVVPARAETARFCSQQCSGRWSLSVRKMPTDHLKGNQFRKGKRPSNAFTSEQVSGADNPRWVEPIEFVCEMCGVTFKRKPWYTRIKGYQARFCSVECRGDHRAEFESGENSPHWVGGPKTYRGRGWLAIRAQVVAEQDGCCASCGVHVGDSLPVNHMLPFRMFETPEAANHRTNLVGLCQSCHMRAEPKRDTLFHAAPPSEKSSTS